MKIHPHFQQEEIAGAKAAADLVRRTPQMSMELALELGRGAMTTRNGDPWAQGFQATMENLAISLPRRSAS